MLVDVLLILAGIGLLTLGGEAVVRGALAAAKRLGVSPLLAGLVIVGFGTSAPELVVSVDAALNQQPDIAIGNVVGSNIGNILLILGLCALISPLATRRSALMRDGMTVILASLLFLLLVWGSALARTDAVILLGGLAVYLVLAYRTESRAHSPAAQVHAQEAEELSLLPRSIPAVVMALVLGLVCLVVGSRLLLRGAVDLSAQLGIPEAVIGLTLVAVGTSLPELAVSVIAAIRRHADVAVGNILGSNIFNLLGILGVSALLQPLPVHARVLAFDQWVMLASAGLLMLFLYTGMRLSRLEGGVLLTAYIAYLVASFTVFA
ncbi:Na+/Ca+ antiporter, CaCA family protein [Thioalkalivibrio sulfidiphilus HL-EbGr7]|uniref:Na+/Ca+ antiporter, CaCA family protein n=1 Tax=Thioalkalivibrio sulfidiphilus (strain HL-EbGR7) TaxID=396588 RepID=B8GM65_THISH|nr:calcium/sodium antiporter [Thioalkalivibrio sulfidiphilus]ACL73652.1 Na+/Ca+ antiporter, CaCA family protein [Thioalkalivibrio sulfidiphilus HL-EbGr7]